MRLDHPASKLARTLILLGTTAFLPMCGSDSQPKHESDAGSATDSGTPGAVADAGLDGGHTGVGPDGGSASGADSSTDGSTTGDQQDGAVSDAGDGGTHPTAAWHLWVMENTTGHLYGYAPQQLTATNGDAPEIDITLSDKIASLHFDAQGNLWGTLNGTTVVQYAAKDVKQSGTATAAVKFTETVTNNEAADFVAFDASGNLWTSGHQGHGAWRYDASSLAALTPTSPAQTPAFKLTTSAPSEVAFDKMGNLYSTVYPGNGAANVGRFTASQLAGTGATSDAPADLLGTVQFLSSLFFSPSGQLVVASQGGNVYRLSPTQLAATGSVNANTTPETTFTITGYNYPGWGTYDPTGVLWISGNIDHFVAISAADLAKTGAVTVTTPGVTIRAPTTNSSASFGSIAIH